MCTPVISSATAPSGIYLVYFLVDFTRRKMTKAANPGQFSASNALLFGVEADGSRGSMMATKNLKRKTPSELRGDLLRKKSSLDIVDEATSLTSVLRKADERFCGSSKRDSSKGSRNTRINEHYPVTKIKRLLCQKENNPKKEAVSNSFLSNRMDSRDENHELKNNSCPTETATSSSRNDSSDLSKDSLKRLNGGTSFRSVRELSLGGEKLDALSPLRVVLFLNIISC
ncbi:hypothetical protein M569_02840 [Genlisea aurea]|uniref:Uncharacterized protein n=1 Tax=Genlisea aurea TaxID=192259 RepID=S8CX21_9LAMI|nr:hypothetical protein M569_02840 [Genlisea aurea]